MPFTAADWETAYALPPAAATALAESLAALGDPPQAQQLLIHLLERARDGGVALATLAAPHAATALARLAYAAPFLLQRLAGRPEALAAGLLADLAPAADADGPATLPWARYVAPAEVAALDEAAFMRLLRIWKYDTYLRLTACDLLGFSDVRATCRGISALADGAIRVAHGYAFAQAVQRQGLPVRGDGNPALGGIIGMGKLGGGELNYASDVDLIYVQDGDDTPCRQPGALQPPPLDATEEADRAAWAAWSAQAAAAATQGEAGGTTSFDFHNRLARQLNRLVGSQQAEGFAFRVDFDLRPNGKSGFLAPNLAFMEQYYLEQGREWERTAMLKARMVTGPADLAARFHSLIRPFVYRRYLDYSALEGVAIVKHDIDRAHRAALDSNLKLGRGGIRESEFLVQALQLLYGGKQPALQVTGHDAALSQLADAGVMTEEEAEAIRRDYWLLRGVENRVQMIAEAQTHELPGDAEERAQILHDFAADFAARQPQVEAALEATRQRTHERFQALFAGLGEQGFPETEAWRDAVRGFLPPEEADAPLARLDGVFGRLMDTRVGERCVFKLAKLLRREEVYRRGTEAAFPRWLDFIEQIGNRNALHTLIEAHPPIVPWISHLFREGGRHAELLIRHPEFLESFFELGGEWRNLTGRIEDILHSARDEEEFLLELQAAKAQGVIRTLTVFLNEAQYGAHQALLSDLADATVRACTRFAWRTVCERMGTPAGAGSDTGDPVHGFAVLALGKLGSREMRFGSDLDLVFVYDQDGTTDQGRSHYEFYTKLAQKLGVLLTSQTQFGRLYELDHRLRPFGTKGVLVPSLGAYRNFFTPGEAAAAEVWNYQAFTRIRPVCGDPALSEALVALIADTWQQRALPPAAIARAVWEMLQRLAQDAGRGRDPAVPAVPLKLGVGGMIGYEFLAQAHFLCAQGRELGGWTAPPPHEIMTRLRDPFLSISELDERLTFYERDGRHELRPEHCDRLAAIGERWRFEEVQALCSRMGTEVAAAFHSWGA